MLFLRGRRYAQLPCLRLPFGVSAFSDAVCLPYCCSGGVGWAASLPLCYQCSSCSGWLAGVRWVLHPVSGSSHRGCVCSLGDSVVAPFLAPLASRALLVVLSSPPAVLDLCGGCALFTACFPLPSGGCASGLRRQFAAKFAVSAALRGWRSLFVLHLLWQWGGLVTCLWPLLLLLCVGLLWGLCCAVLSPWALARPPLLGPCWTVPLNL